MKKIFAFLFFMLLICGCSNVEKENIENDWVLKKVEENNLHLFYTTKDGIHVYSSFEQILFKEREEVFDLKEMLNNETLSINDFIQKMDLYLQANDGGSSYYVSKDGFTSQKIYLALCNSLPGNGGIHDIFIDDNEEDILDYCVAR